MLLLFPVNKQHSSDLKLNNYKVIKSRENLKTVLTVHVQKCCLGFQSCHMCCGLVTGLCCVVINSWLCLSNIFASLGGQCECSFCGLVHSAFCMLFHVRGCQGAEDVGTQDRGSSGHLWPRESSNLESVISCVGLVIVASSLGQSFHEDNPMFPLCLPLSTNALVVNPGGRQGLWKNLLAASENWASLRSGAKSRSLCWKTSSLQNVT